MSPLCMDTGCEHNITGSLSAGEGSGNTAGSEREPEGQGMENRGTKRKQKNRDAARKSRRKQTERADELHEELQRLEQANSAFRKEINALKKEARHYTTTLESHKPFCCLLVSQSTVDATVPQHCSSPTKDLSQTSCSTLAAVPSPSTSLTPGLVHHTHDCVDNTHRSPSLSSGSPAELFNTSPSSDAMAVPFSVAAPHSLFSKEPLSLITSRPTNADLTPLCSSLISKPTSSATAQPPSKQDINDSYSMSANALVHMNSPGVLPSSHTDPSTLHLGVLDPFLMKQASFQTASSNVVPPYSRPPATENTVLAAQGFPMNVPQLHSCKFSGNPQKLSPPRIPLASPLQDPALQSLSVSLRVNQNPSPAPAFTFKPSYSQQMTSTPTSLLSLLTVPSPVNVPQTTCSSSDASLTQPKSSLGDPSRELSFSELLEVNDWLLN
ncbi:hypothetical protein PAMP_015597 [Pampus punctatissimus]